jgi:hypothetical protein
MTQKLFYIEHMVAGEPVEYEYEVEAEGYEPYVPARTYGPPEDCYPAEGGCAEVSSGGTLRRRLTSPKGSPWEHVAWSIFVEGLIAQEGFTDDFADSPKGIFRKTALQKAEQYVEDELTQACEEELQSHYEDAMESRAEARRERDWDF